MQQQRSPARLGSWRDAQLKDARCRGIHGEDRPCSLLMNRQSQDPRSGPKRGQCGLTHGASRDNLKHFGSQPSNAHHGRTHVSSPRVRMRRCVSNTSEPASSSLAWASMPRNRPICSKRLGRHRSERTLPLEARQGCTFVTSRTAGPLYKAADWSLL